MCTSFHVSNPGLRLAPWLKPKICPGWMCLSCCVQLSLGLWQRHMCNLPCLISSLEDTRSLSTSQPFLLLLFFRNKSFYFLFFLFYVCCTWAFLFSPHVRELCGGAKASRLQWLLLLQSMGSRRLSFGSCGAQA